MKFKEYINYQNESFIKIFNWLEQLDEEKLLEEDVNEASGKNGISFPIVKFIRIKSAVKKLMKAKIAQAMEEIHYLVLTHSDKWKDMDAKSHEVSKESYKVKKKAIEDDVETIKSKLDVLAGSNNFLKNLVSYGKLKAKTMANKKIIQKAGEFMPDSTKEKYEVTYNKAKKEETEAHTNIKKLESELKAATAAAKKYKEEENKKKTE